MAKETNVTISFGGIMIVLLIILCVGDPDLLDALIGYVQSLSNK